MNIEVKSDAEMKAFGRSVASAISGGEVIELIGDVGAGKTTFVKGLAAGLGIDEDVQSPSFTISRVYDTPESLRLVHYDFYRLHDAGILADELAENQSDSEAVTVIEWADIVEGVLPEDRLRLTIDATGEASRRVTIDPTGSASQKFREVLNDFAA